MVVDAFDAFIAKISRSVADDAQVAPAALTNILPSDDNPETGVENAESVYARTFIPVTVATVVATRNVNL